MVAVFLSTIGAAQAAMIPIQGDPVVTESGRVAGTSLPSGVQAYLGIPYAKPPVQALRWAPPTPLHWDGVWNADRFGPECIQILRPHGVNHYFGEEPTSEDCLYLNIWRPANVPAGRKLPVIVFIYGGGGTVGSSGMAVYSGANVALQGALFVSFNYRLGIMGYMAHPDLTREQGGHSGNYGYLDQVAALEWIHANITAFGGDPTKVLLTGQSFGAGSVAAQLFSPLSKGLFRAAAMWSACNFSAGPFSADPVPLETAEKTGLDIEQRLGAHSLGDMRDVPADKILALQEEHQLGANVSGLRLPPVLDGLFWTKDKRAVLASHEFNDVPIMAGSNGDDLDAGRYPLTAATSIAEFRDLARKMYGPQTQEFLALYPVKDDKDVPRVAHEAARENGFLKNSRTCADLMGRYNTSPAYIELFNKRQPYVPGVVIADQNPATVGAYHTGDVPYWFGTFDAFNSIRPTRQWTDEDRALSGSMMHALISMADSGSPSSSRLKWPAWNAKHQEIMVFDTDARIDTLPVSRMDWLAAHPANDVPRPGPARKTRD